MEEKYLPYVKENSLYRCDGKKVEYPAIVMDEQRLIAYGDNKEIEKIYTVMKRNTNKRILYFDFSKTKLSCEKTCQYIIDLLNKNNIPKTIEELSLMSNS